jgi:hypothetical protein
MESSEELHILAIININYMDRLLFDNIVTYLINALPGSSSVNTVHYATIEEAGFSMSSAQSNTRNGVFCDQLLGYETP